MHLNGLQTNKSFAIFRKDQDKEPEKDPLQEEISMTLAIVYSNMAGMSKSESFSQIILMTRPICILFGLYQ